MTRQVKSIVEELFHRVAEGMDISPSALMTVVGDPISQRLITAAMMAERSEERAIVNYGFPEILAIEEAHREHAQVQKQMGTRKNPKKKKN